MNVPCLNSKSVTVTESAANVPAEKQQHGDESAAPAPAAPGPGRNGLRVRRQRADARHVRYPVRMRAVRLLLT
jgi:hypothetical protein